MAISGALGNDWGLRPVLFSVHGFHMESYPTMVALGVLCGVITYYYQTKGLKRRNDYYYIFFMGLVYGTIGAKIPVLLENWHQIIFERNYDALLSGRTLVGGLILGTLGVIYTRRKMGITARTGNYFVPAISVGLIFGRIGCLLRGCCYGKPTGYWFGINFGDGIGRYPVQVFEIIFFSTWLAIGLLYNKRHASDAKVMESGALFNLFLGSYFIFRFFIEYLREEPVYRYGMTLAQVVSIIVVTGLGLSMLNAHYYGRRK